MYDVIGPSLPGALCRVATLRLPPYLDGFAQGTPAAVMASITHDGRTFTINDRRRWMSGATIDLGRHDRSVWPALLDSIRAAGFNSVGVRLAWALHERTPGSIDFTDDLDAAALIRAIGDRKMLAFVRPGPFVGAGYDAGGLPGWLVDGRPGIVRTGDGAFKEAVSRWFTALFREIGDLQLTSRGAGGPITLIQNEHAYFKGSDALAGAYLTETARYLREAGALVPIINGNNLFAAGEGELDGWVYDGDAFSTVRQLRVVRPDTPPILLDLPLAEQRVFGEAPSAPDPDEAARRFAQALAAGGQVFVDGVAAGLTPGFWAGRDGRRPNRFSTPASHPAAPIDTLGRPTPALTPIARLVTFATSFERVLGAIDWESRQPAVAAPGSAGADAVISLDGDLGGVVFLFPGAPSASRRGPRTLILPDGRSLEIHTGALPVLPLLINVRLGARATLDFCSFPALANLGDSFVCYGPPGARGVISIDGAILETSAPDKAHPSVIKHAGVTIVVLSADHAAGAVLLEDSIVLTDAGLALRRSGAVESLQPRARVSAKPRPPRLTRWTAAPDPAVTDARSDAWVTIDAPAPNAALPARTGGADGYRWLRCAFTAAKAVRGSLGFFNLNDRGLVWFDGEPLGVLGDGPDTTQRTIPVSIAKGAHALMVLVDHLGRPDWGGMIGEPVGLAAPPRFVAAFRVNKPKLASHEPVAPARALPARVWDLHDDDTADPRRIEWRFTYRRTAPLFLRIESFPGPAPALAMLNGSAFLWLTPGDHVSMRLPPETLRRGNNVLQFVVLGDAGRALAPIAGAVTLYETKADLPGTPAWSAAAWSPPAPDHLEALNKNGFKRFAGAPAWFGARFTHGPDDAPVALIPAGLSKGAVVVNGRVLGRTLLPPRSRTKPLPLPIPPSLLRRDEANDLMIFDERGAAPARVRLTLQ